jgi:hypothetical protein
MRLEDAIMLFNNNLYDGAFYIAGYALELTFKAKICECLKIDEFYHLHAAKSDFSKVFLVHNLNRLLILSGLYTVYETDKLTDSRLMLAWSTAIKWSENNRYDKRGTHVSREVQDFINAIKFLIQWINTH